MKIETLQKVAQIYFIGKINFMMKVFFQETRIQTFPLVCGRPTLPPNIA